MERDDEVARRVELFWQGIQVAYGARGRVEAFETLMLLGTFLRESGCGVFDLFISTGDGEDDKGGGWLADDTSLYVDTDRDWVGCLLALKVTRAPLRYAEPHDRYEGNFRIAKNPRRLKRWQEMYDEILSNVPVT